MSISCSKQTSHAFLFWEEELKTSIVELSSLNPEDQFEGKLATVSWKGSSVSGKVLKISDCMEELENFDDEFISRTLKQKNSEPLGKRKSKRPSHLVGISASERQVACAMSQKPQGNKKTEADRRKKSKEKTVDEQRKDESERETDRQILQKAKEQRSILKTPLKQVSKDQTVSNRVSADSSDSESDNNESDDGMESQDQSDIPLGRMSESDHDGAASTSVSCGAATFSAIKSKAISLYMDLKAFLCVNEDDSSSLSLSTGFQGSYQEPLPLPADQQKKAVELVRGSGVFTSNAAHLRILSAGGTEGRDSGRKLTRALLLEMFGREALGQMIAVGPHPVKRAIHRHILKAMHSYVLKHTTSPDNKKSGIKWATFVDTINRKTGAVLRHDYSKKGDVSKSAEKRKSSTPSKSPRKKQRSSPTSKVPTRSSPRKKLLPDTLQLNVGSNINQEVNVPLSSNSQTLSSPRKSSSKPNAASSSSSGTTQANSNGADSSKNSAFQGHQQYPNGWFNQPNAEYPFPTRSSPRKRHQMANSVSSSGSEVISGGAAASSSNFAQAQNRGTHLPEFSYPGGGFRPQTAYVPPTFYHGAPPVPPYEQCDQYFPPYPNYWYHGQYNAQQGSAFDQHSSHHQPAPMWPAGNEAAVSEDNTLIVL